MSVAFDTLAFSERLQSAGCEKRLADEHAKLARDMILTDQVTKSDLRAALDLTESRMTVRAGLIAAASIGILSTIIVLF